MQDVQERAAFLRFPSSVETCIHKNVPFKEKEMQY